VHVVGEGEGQVEVGPAVAAADRERADLRGGDDALVRVGQVEDPLAGAVACLDREQAQR
jgi:hypothetical protein